MQDDHSLELSLNSTMIGLFTTLAAGFFGAMQWAIGMMFQMKAITPEAIQGRSEVVGTIVEYLGFPMVAFACAAIWFYISRISLLKEQISEVKRTSR